jgi:hypothetical protein
MQYLTAVETKNKREQKRIADNSQSENQLLSANID